MSEIWLISDEHYFHERMLEYQRRPWTRTKEQIHAMVNWHNELVAPEDTVWHLGDLCFTENWRELWHLLKKLNGRHHMVFGNHDWMYIWNYIEAGIISAHTSFQLEDYILVHDPAVAGVLTDKKFIHGHVHSAGLQIAPNCYNVSVEMHNYRPVNFKDIKKVF